MREWEGESLGTGGRDGGTCPGRRARGGASGPALTPPPPGNGKVDVRLPGKGNSHSHGARLVHLIITMITWVWTSRLSIMNSLSVGAEEGRGERPVLRRRPLLLHTRPSVSTLPRHTCPIYTHTCSPHPHTFWTHLHFFDTPTQRGGGGVRSCADAPSSCCGLGVEWPYPLQKEPLDTCCTTTRCSKYGPCSRYPEVLSVTQSQHVNLRLVGQPGCGL